MRLLSLNLEDFRNVTRASLTFSSDRIFFLGSNGQENQSSRGDWLSRYINARFEKWYGWFGKGRATDKSELLSFSDDDGNEREVFISFRFKGEKQVEVDGEKIKKLGEYLGYFPSVTLSSRDFRLIREGPSDRRKWLDLLLSSSSNEYLNYLQEYTRCLRERNILLKRNASDGELLAFEQSLATNAIKLYSFRCEAVPKVSKILRDSYLSLTAEEEVADLAYSPDLSIESEEKYLKKLCEERGRDRILGSTRRGPHRDDFLFRLQERDARVFASEGQQRGLVLSLRLAEFAFLREALGRIPLILADDVLGELDNVRKANFRKLLPAEAQVFATGTSYPSQSESAIWETFEVLAGNFKRI